MTKLAFWARLGPNRTIEVPLDVVAQISENEPVRVIIVQHDGDESEERMWRELTSNQFLQGYDAEDELYDHLPDG